MRILAIETTATAGSLAAARGGTLLAELPLSAHSGSARSLAPGLKQILEQVGWRPRDVELVAVAAGPGSFTGLRVGVTTAKTFAYCVGASVLGVDTLEVIAAAVPDGVEALSVGLDAQRGEVVAQCFRRDAHGLLAPQGPWALVPGSDWLADLPRGTCVAGPVLRTLGTSAPEHVVLLDRQYWFPTAAAVAAVALRRYEAGQRDDVWSLLPRYCRRSAAEEKREAMRRPS